MTFLKKFLLKFPFSLKRFQNGAENVFSSIVQAVTEVLNKSHFSLQMGNCPVPVAEHSGQYVTKALTFQVVLSFCTSNRLILIVCGRQIKMFPTCFEKTMLIL